MIRASDDPDVYVQRVADAERLARAMHCLIALFGEYDRLLLRATPTHVGRPAARPSDRWPAGVERPLKELARVEAIVGALHEFAHDGGRSLEPTA